MTNTDPIVLDSVHDAADWLALQQAATLRGRARVGRARLLSANLGPLVAGGVILYALVGWRGPRPLLAFGLGLLTFAGVVLWTARLLQRAFRPVESGIFIGRTRTQLSIEGIRTEREGSSALTRWSTLQEVTRSDSHLFLWVDSAAAYPLPLRDLPPQTDAETVLRAIQEFAGRTVPTSTPLPAAAAPTPPAAKADQRLLRPKAFLSALASRLAWRTPRDECRSASTDSVIASSIAIALVVWLAFDRLAAGVGAEWYPGGLAGLAWYGLGMLGLAFVLQRVAARVASSRAVLAAIAGMLPLVLTLALATERWAPEWLRGPAHAGLAVAATLRLSRLVTADRNRRAWATLATLAAGVLFAWLTNLAWVDPHLWFAARTDEQDGGWKQSEQLLFDQADRIDAAAARLPAGRSGRPEVFFLGFAGAGEQKVFAEEAKLAERVVTQRYDARGRSLLLLNDQRDRHGWPMATVPGLRRALTRLGEHMDRNADVLFLVLTSHGSDDASLSVSNGPWPLEDLDGPSLRAALDASGIRWRVILISACYSGSFIEPLADDNTIIVTSAAADRTSFGCSNDRDATDFGAAFLRDALPRAASLEAAFEEARMVVAAGEKAAHLDASSPQLRTGRTIGKYWAQVEARLTQPSPEQALPRAREARRREPADPLSAQ